MTRDEILNMPAGREMDALVAVKVFGWVDMGIEFKPRYQKPSKERYGVEILYELPRYSTDIAAAWQVVEKMIERNYSIEVGNGGDEYYAWFLGYGDESIYSPTAPLAICRAALLAVGGDT